MGCYAFPNHVLPRHPEPRPRRRGAAPPSTPCAPSCRTARWCTPPGCAVTGDDRSGFAAARRGGARGRPVRRAGRRPGRPLRPRLLRRGLRRRRPALPGVQAELLDALLGTGTPVVVVVVSGRPYALGEVATAARPALVQAFMPGEEGGPAIAGVLSGRVQPGGRLPVQIPRDPGGQPGTYLQPPLGSARAAASATSTRRRCSPSATARRTPSSRWATSGRRRRAAHRRRVHGHACGCATWATRAGDEVVQLYLHDSVAEVARPVRQLVGFARVSLEPGAPPTSRSACTPTGRPSPGRDLQRIVEPGRRRAAGRHVGGRPALPRRGCG